MFSEYKIKQEKGEEVLYITVVFHQETASEFGVTSKTSLLDRIVEYIRDKKIEFHGKKVCLVASGIVITLLLTATNLQTLKQNQLSVTPIIAHNSVFNQPITRELAWEWDSIEREEKYSPIEEIPIIDEKQETPEPVKKEPTESTPKESEKTPIIEQQKPSQPKPVVEKTISVMRYNGIIEIITLEDYIIGVVASEMPVLFHSEALKAQAVVARTYALRRTDLGYMLSDTVRDQVYKDKSQLQNLWGNKFDEYYQKVKNAVLETRGQVITYQGNLIDTVYFSNSNGYTEDASFVWGESLPYLKSVESSWDVGTSAYANKSYKSFPDMSAILGFIVNNKTSVEIISRTTGNRIQKIRIGENIYTGLEMRNLLGLRSTDFDIVVDEDGMHFTTKGYGHGVGMSQYGANGMAKVGYSYKAIIHYYYQSIQIENR